ncbi:HAD-like protein, partial [Glonium stellatum]
MEKPDFDTLILDLGGVIIRGTGLSTAVKAVSQKTFAEIRSSQTWEAYQCGFVSEADCYSQVIAEVTEPIAASQVHQAIVEARRAVRFNHALASAIEELKDAARGGLRVFAMSNISQPDYAEIKSRKSIVWDLFDGIYTSWSAGMRKPDMDFYQHVLNETNANPLRTVFVDDSIDNVLIARSCGMKGLLFENTETCARMLRNLFGNPLSRGERYLAENARGLESVTVDGDIVYDNFSQFLILSATGKRDIVAFKEHHGKDTWNYLAEDLKHTLKMFPDDVDTTSIALMTLCVKREVADSAMDKILRNVNSKGILKAFFSESMTIIDPVSCVNAIRLFHRYGRGNQVQKSMNWVIEVLTHQAYVDGTGRYVHPDCFLYFLSCLFTECEERQTPLSTHLREALKEGLRERIGLAGDSLGIAVRALACQAMDIDSTVDVNVLLKSQRDDGGWQPGWLSRYGPMGTLIGNRGVTTAFAIKAI